MKRFFSLTFIMSGLLLILSACSSSANVGTNNNGFFHHYFVSPFAVVIKATAHLFNGDYGIAIIILTLIIRLILMPLTMHTYKNQQQMQEKMKKLKPEMDKLQTKIKAAKSKEEQAKLQQEMMLLYQKHGVNPMNMGCLPILIQMPILMGFYYAIRGSKEIASHSFLWFSLGKADIPMAILAGVIYLVQAQISMIGIPEEQKKQMRYMMLLSPVMILFVSFTAPAVLPLYWTVGGLFLCGQTLLAKKLYQPRHPKENSTAKS
ncbi:membrane protein insertase YidC 1 [Weizmannia acidilactici]|uniref:Membrane protein insertase YidC n=1 Tax=Weizmannia acidilactici TaxID=2607726 RepID=A0A5J4JH91_9BACI|nr:membrane protein insertase YidC [Weizmannia acidilactici]GER68252.1 membrane protein insertase YidC 1 [Weizmannia acidilactici]GER71091.1 membrane protein insertase YidC 1 [Weizmannia acidilactici]GER74527.1 membrane protein insertase YidC 1 [Weizmannia acidilactici]